MCVTESDLVGRVVEEPDVDTLEAWLADGVCEALDGCVVELDGHCPHGLPSWFLHLGLI